MQASGYGPVVPDTANAKIELTEEGKFRVYCGVVDMGQGNASTNLQIAGSILGQETAQMEVVLPDTDRTLPSGSASASRCTYTFGNALIGAAEILRDRILQRAADLFMAPGTDQMALIPGAVKWLATGREIPLSKMAQLLNEGERVATSRFRAPIATDTVTSDENLKLHGLPHTLFSYGAHIAWVEVDELTGAVDVKKYLAVSDCGKVMNPQIYEQQVHGGIAQGLGYALSEEFQVEDGKVRTPDFFTYIMPTAADIPEIDSVAVELYEPTGPFGLKGVGEVSTNGPLPVVANAVADACGIRVLRSSAHGRTGPSSPSRKRKEGACRVKITFKLNGIETHLDVSPDRRVVDVLREDLGLTGTKESCAAGDCGACTVLVDGESKLSCLMLAAQLEGREITTIEGLAQGDCLHAVQDAFAEHGAVQCGFCIPGMALASVDLLRRNPNPSREEIREGLAGNLCRCTGYQKIVDAVQMAAGSVKEEEDS